MQIQFLTRCASLTVGSIKSATEAGAETEEVNLRNTAEGYKFVTFAAPAGTFKLGSLYNVTVDDKE